MRLYELDFSLISFSGDEDEEMMLAQPKSETQIIGIKQ